MKKQTNISMVLFLIALPILARAIWYYRGDYTPPVLDNVSELDISPEFPEYNLSKDDPIESDGFVLVDLSHDNNVNIDDLNPLRERLNNRNVAMEIRRDGFGDSLENQLGGALAYIVIAPSFEYDSIEISAVKSFVNDGGRVLLAADPTRPALTDGFMADDLESVLFPLSAVPAINSIANSFGVNYFDDYIYNIEENEGNYRNISLVISEDSPLTADLDKVVFFASHSLQTEGEVLLSGDKNTLSPIRGGESDLVAATLTTNDQVLALGDFTFITPAFFTIEDNENFLGNIADWLVTPERSFGIHDFPLMFTRPVDLIPLAEGPLDPRLVLESSFIEKALRDKGVDLKLNSKHDLDHDTLYVGSFEDKEGIERFLSRAGVSIRISDEVVESISIVGLGEVNPEGTTLFIISASEDDVVLITLAEDTETAIEALVQLAEGRIFGCLDRDEVTICSTGVEIKDKDSSNSNEDNDQSSGSSSNSGIPRLGSVEESDDAFDSGVLSLEFFANESPNVTSEPDDVYIFTIELDESIDILWQYAWCASSLEILQENFEYIELLFFMNDELVPLSSFSVIEEDFGENGACKVHYVLVTDWPDGEQFLSTWVIFEAEIDDGFDVYEAGTHFFEYFVSVGQ